jgi:predicted anti-sigma-YlaC factor YlaD
MNRLTANGGPHIEDGDLVRLLDGECPPQEERLLRTHLGECADCRREADELERLSKGFSLALERGDPASAAGEAGEIRQDEAVVPRLPAHRWTRFQILRAAAVVALLITALAVSPARAWLVDGWQAIKSLFVEEPAPEQPAAIEPEAPDVTAVVSFALVGPRFRLEVSSTQSRGTISLAVDSVPSASARVLGGNGHEELVVLQGGLRLLNGFESTASSEIVIPHYVTAVEVEIANRTAMLLNEAALSETARWEIDLTPDQER